MAQRSPLDRFVAQPRKYSVVAGWCFGLFWVLLLVRLTAAPLRTPHLS